MDEQAVLPGWVRPTPYELRDLSCLALGLVVEQRSRDASGIVAALGWLCGLLRGPATGRTEGAASRDVALCELCAAESLLGDGAPPPPLEEVCRILGVEFRTPMQVDAGYASGVWRTLHWVLGSASTPPMILPIRGADGAVLGEVAIYAELLARMDETADARQREQARTDAAALAAESRRLAARIEDTAARVRA